MGVEGPTFDEFPYYAAKRAQEQVVAAEGDVSSTVVKSAQFDEFAGTTRYGSKDLSVRQIV